VAAGTVFAGLVVDVLPRLLTPHVRAVPLMLGMALSLFAMMVIRTRAAGAGGTTLGITIGADVVVDGILIGLSVADGAPTGYVFVAALVPEMTLLGTEVSQELAREASSRVGRIAAPALLGLAVIAGAVVGAWMHSGPDWLTTFVQAFGAITLAYLVTEELLREAHREGDTPTRAVLFFVGFIPLFVIAALVQ
jgi:ZIP family zinc transporter